ncbi:unnamed protein product [Caenorhabditis auriculariae]|uniref:FAD dependent oxidoreductase domain-containing protein n=1 Tax=Caenorhabditis auriculariae TaxID=2777116 RepID=A0A8S1H5K0_9PELO|nr:unnamed protein product [Caenorhabditis auriculariae]
MPQEVAILGTGIIGISTALAIQENCPKVKVTAITKDLSPNLTSDVAAGLIKPYYCSDDEEKIISWTKATISRIQTFMREFPGTGAELMSGYHFSREVEPIPFWSRVVRNFRVMSSEEIEEVTGKSCYKTGFFYTTWYLEPTAYISYCQKKFLANGGIIRQENIENLDHIGQNFEIIVNCTGLGSRKLFNDTTVYPVRGQIIRVRCPQVKHFFNDDDFYALLNGDCVILGGTTDVNNWDTTVNEETARRIFEGNVGVFKSLSKSTILSHHVGLRPARPQVRLEACFETTPSGQKRQVIHNYGHGGSGITLHWGCALEVAKLVEEIRGKSRL